MAVNYLDIKYENQNVISTQNATFEEVEKREKTLKNEVLVKIMLNLD